jgi:hypothetical protein
VNRLQAEWQRLYAPHTTNAANAANAGSADGSTPTLIDPQGQVRAMVLQLARPAEWAAVSAVWQGVQADLAWPAPAIAVSGTDGYQLWFSLAEPWPAAQALALLQALCQRYLGGIAPERITLMPRVDQATPAQAVHAAAVPAQQGELEQWSSFVAPDLAPMFAQTPWLDIPPGIDGQAELLARLHSIQAQDARAALAQLQAASASTPASMSMSTASPASSTGHALAGTAIASVSPGAGLTPKAFLQAVMNDQSAPLALRIEAAKALLPFCPG